MARLYGTMTSDSRKTEITSRGNEVITGVILWGNKTDPHLALSYKVTWPKSADKPEVIIRAGAGLELTDNTD